MSCLRICGLSLAIPVLCLTVSISTNAQNRARGRDVARDNHQVAQRYSDRLSEQRSRPVQNSRIHPALTNDRTGLKNLFNYRPDINGPGTSYLGAKAFPYPVPAADETSSPLEQSRPRTYHRVPRYDNYTGDLLIPASRNIGFKLRIGNGTAYPY